jgi:hypothetical protein
MRGRRVWFAMQPGHTRHAAAAEPQARHIIAPQDTEVRQHTGEYDMKFWHFALAAVTIGTAVGFAWPAAADPLPMDNPTPINGVEVVCTGIGSAQDDPHWKAYPVRVEFSNGGAQYLAGAHVTLSSGGKQLVAFDCSGSWVLFSVKPGTYKVSATLTNQAGSGERSATFSAPASGQKRVVIQFPIQPNQ